MGLNQVEIVSAAIDLLDEGGLSGVTLRALGNRLGVSAPTLYWHIRGKRHLLDLMASRIYNQAFSASLNEPAPGQPWSEWASDRWTSMRTSLLAHRDGALVVAGNRPAPDELDYIERPLAALVNAGFSAADALRSSIALTTYTIGDAVDTQSNAAREPEEATDQHALMEAIRSGKVPVLAESVHSYGTAEERYHFGLTLLIEGMKARLSAPLNDPTESATL